jgi:hypothetical protein
MNDRMPIYHETYRGAYSPARKSGMNDADAHDAALRAVTRLAESATLEQVAESDPQLGVLTELAHQTGRIANALNSAPERQTFDADYVREKWDALGMRMYDDMAIALLESLGFTVEKTGTTKRV